MKQPSQILSTPCEDEEQNQVKLPQKIPITIEDGTHDSLTGLAMSLVNPKDVVKAFLHSGILHPKIVSLASEFCRLPSVEKDDLQSSVRTFLSSRQIETSSSGDNIIEEKDERYVNEIDIPWDLILARCKRIPACLNFPPSSNTLIKDSRCPA